MKYPRPVEEMVLDALEELSKRKLYTPTWQDVKFEIRHLFGVWVSEATLVRTLRWLAEHGDIHRDERGHFWK